VAVNQLDEGCGTILADRRASSIVIAAPFAISLGDGCGGAVGDHAALLVSTSLAAMYRGKGRFKDGFVEQAQSGSA